MPPPFELESRKEEPADDKTAKEARTISVVSLVVMFLTLAFMLATMTLVLSVDSSIDDLGESMTNLTETLKTTTTSEVAFYKDASLDLSDNVCEGAKPTVEGFDNIDCVTASVEQAGGDVTLGYEGGFDTTAEPITTPYFKAGLCPVNVHWHLGAEHLSDGEFDADGSGPEDDHRRLLRGGDRKLAADARLGGRCHHYDSHDPKFTTPYEWKHCVNMVVGETYEVHWPHSNMGACGTPLQYQTPFYDGVFCKLAEATADAVGSEATGAVELTSTNEQIGVQAQVFTIVNDENYYYPDLMRGMIVDGSKGAEITAYTGSTTGTTRDNEICSRYAPITWHVDRKCHLISASTFDKMCADMKAQQDDMSGDLYAHGAREVVVNEFTANNQQDIQAAYTA